MSETDFELLDSQLRSLLADEADPLANGSNFVALLYNVIEDVN
jgi:putative methionine-R-sulfoxide reductase with GAF domain